jgi:ribosomal protein L11 methyltransferase
VTVPEADEDQAVAALWEAGTAGIEVRPAPEGRVRLVAYFEEDSVLQASAGALEASALRSSGPTPESPASTGLPLPPGPDALVRRAGAALAAAGLLPPRVAVEPAPVEDVDWVARFREGFHAFRAGRFTVAPPWDLPAPPPANGVGDIAADAPFAPSPDTLVVDPGRAFGTGTHETTRLCLSALEGLASRRPLGRTLDLGAGTGLLSVAAARLGASFVCASDIDPEASHASVHHARLNGVRLAVVRADGGCGFRPGAFDLVLANLMALLLVDRASEIRALLAPGGALVLSGLLVDDVPFVRAAFETGPLPPGPGVAEHSRGFGDSSHPHRRFTASPGALTVRLEGEWAALVYEEVR